MAKPFVYASVTERNVIKSIVLQTLLKEISSGVGNKLSTRIDMANKRNTQERLVDVARFEKGHSRDSPVSSSRTDFGR